MTTSTTPGRGFSLEADLSAMYRPIQPPTHLAERIDGRVSAARLLHRTRSARSVRRNLVLAASVALLAVLALAGAAVAQRLASGCGITFENGISFSDCVIARPGLTNAGQPFAGIDILERTPAEAAEMAAEKGYTIRWQIEDRGGTQGFDDDTMRFADTPPACGSIAAGSVIEDHRIQMVVIMNDPLTPGSGC